MFLTTWKWVLHGNGSIFFNYSKEEGWFLWSLKFLSCFVLPKQNTNKNSPWNERGESNDRVQLSVPLPQQAKQNWCYSAPWCPLLSLQSLLVAHLGFRKFRITYFHLFIHSFIAYTFIECPTLCQELCCTLWVQRCITLMFFLERGCGLLRQADTQRDHFDTVK